MTPTRADRHDRVIYLDYHASTPTDAHVIAAMEPFLAKYCGNPQSVDHVEGWRAHEAVSKARRDIASALKVDPDEIVFTSGATEANNFAILGLARRAQASRRRILISAIEHKCVLAAAKATESLGFAVEIIPVDRYGFVDLDDLKTRLRADVLLVSIMSVNNEVGTVQRMREVADYAHAVGAYVHSDSVQALAAGPLDLAAWDVDLLSLSGHKIYAPKGIGLLFIRRDIQAMVEPLMYGGGQQDGLRSGTLPVPLCVGLAKAIVLMSGEGAADESQRLRALRKALVNKLQLVDERICLNGPPVNSRHPGNANIRFAGIDARDLLAMLQPRVAASTSSACISGTERSSHVLRAIGLNDEEALGSVRFCVGRYTLDTDIDEAVELIAEALFTLRECHTSRR